MVWARTRLTIWEDLFPPVKKIYFRFEGKHPEKFYTKVGELLKRIFAVPDAYIQEKDYNWKKMENGHKFKINWLLTKPFDRWSYLNMDIDLKGYSENGYGKVSVVFEPRVVTEFPQDYVWQQTVFYEVLRKLWDSLFYKRTRERLYDESRELCMRFQAELKHFGVVLNES